MDAKKLIGSIVTDNESNKLGRIIRVVKHPSAVTEKLTPHLVILVQRFLKKDSIVLIEESKITKFEKDYVWLALSKDEFHQLPKTDEIIKDYRREFLADKDYKPPQKGQGAGRK